MLKYETDVTSQIAVRERVTVNTASERFCLRHIAADVDGMIAGDGMRIERWSSTLAGVETSQFERESVGCTTALCKLLLEN
jgi:hypothetical protein